MPYGTAGDALMAEQWGRDDGPGTALDGASQSERCEGQSCVMYRMLRREQDSAVSLDDGVDEDVKNIAPVAKNA